MSDVKISFIPSGGVKRKSFAAQMGLAVTELSIDDIGKNIFYLYDGGRVDENLLEASSAVICNGSVEICTDKDVIGINDFDFINDGSVVNISESGKLRILFDPKSCNNALFVTDACNNYCIMCPQPPKPFISPNTKSYLSEVVRLIRSEDAPETLGITGGEPTVIKHELIEVIQEVTAKFPDTIIQLLSNGRLFSYRDYSLAMSSVAPNMFVGIPLFGATSDIHDFIVQSKGAFNQTIAGIYECRRNGISIELRVVLHKYTIEELDLIVEFILRTLPFVNHVALMGMENMGFVKMNYSELWIDPIDYKSSLTNAVKTLDKGGISTSVFNLPFCVLDQEIWKYSKQSISDFKTVYLEQCNLCTKKSECTGFFSSTNDKFKLTDSNNISSII